jgi:Mor family transcriptional regulator
MAELTDIIADELTQGEPSFTDGTARRLAARLVARLAREFGGSSLYVPKADALERTLRDARMWADFDGTRDSLAALARREGMTEVHAYRVLAAQRALHRSDTQPDLFDSPNDGDPRPC